MEACETAPAVPTGTFTAAGAPGTSPVSHLSSHHWRAPPSWEGTRSQEVERKSMKLETREREQREWNEELVLETTNSTDSSTEKEKTRADDARNGVGTSADPADSERTIRKHDGRSLHTHTTEVTRPEQHELLSLTPRETGNRTDLRRLGKRNSSTKSSCRRNLQTQMALPENPSQCLNRTDSNSTPSPPENEVGRKLRNSFHEAS